MFLSNFNSSVEFAICSGILSGEGSYHMESSPPICNINLLAGFCMVGDFSGGYSQTDRNFNFNINFSATVDSYMNSSFSYSFLHLLKYLLVFRIIKLESTSKLRHKLRQYLNVCFFYSLFFYIYFRNKSDMRLIYFIIVFVFTYSLVRLPLDVHSLNQKLTFKFNFYIRFHLYLQ